MTGYIKRSDLAAKLTDLMLSPWASGTSLAHGAGRQEALHLIQDMINGEVPDYMKIPAADVVEVVRCQDCKYLGIKDFVYGYCENQCGLHGIVRPESYCSRGERKEGNNAK